MSDEMNSDEDGPQDEVGAPIADEAPETAGDVVDDPVDLGTTDMDSENSPGLAQMGGEAKGSAFMGVPSEVSISVGKARPLVSDLVNLRRDSVIALDSKIDDPVEIFIGDRLIARGELQEMEGDEGQLGVRLTEVADLSSGV